MASPRPTGRRRLGSQPEWNAPLIPARLLRYWRIVDDEPCWTIDWREFFMSGFPEFIGDGPPPVGDMGGFHVVFHLRIKESGKLVFWADDGCVISRNGEVAHSNRGAHGPHFGGSIEKPGNPVALRLAPQILGRKPEQRICPYRRETETVPLQEAR